jgi:hypothetical protein
VLWKSSSRAELGKYVANLAKGMAIKKILPKLPLPAVITGAFLAYKLAKQVVKHAKREGDNPFWQAYIRAN